MIVNLDVVDVYTSWENENTLKNAKNNNLLQTKRSLNITISAKEGPVFTFRLPEGGGSLPFPRVSYATAYDISDNQATRAGFNRSEALG